MEEKFGTIFVDGKLVNLDNIPIEELEELIKKQKIKVKNLEKEIDDNIEHFDDDEIEL